MRAGNVIFIILLFIVGHACVEPLDLKSVSYKNVLVVDGLITNAQRPSQIKLSRTSLLDERKFIPEKGANVIVERQSGSQIQFTEVKPGIYESFGFSGVVGEGYTLLVTTSHGHEYKSQQVVLNNVPPIGNIQAEFVTTPKRGIKITVDTEDPQNKTHRYRWDYVETYEVQTPFPSNYVVLPGTDEATWRYDRVDQCWASDTLRDVLIKTTSAQDHDEVVAFPLRFIPEDSYIFRIKYSMYVQQFALSEEAFNYWETVRTFNETQGTLTDVQPGTINSNIVGITDPSETVLGYFDASAVSEQRVFFDYKNFLSAGYKRPTFRSSCEQNEPVLVKEFLIAKYMLTHDHYLSIWDVIGTSPTADFELFPKACCDCSDMGTTVRPSFWR
jgi:hypothetical protein